MNNVLHIRYGKEDQTAAIFFVKYNKNVEYRAGETIDQSLAILSKNGA
jgi:hypothetical protein